MRAKSALALLVVCAGAAMPAAAQQERRPEPPLSGPRVREQRIPGVEQGFSEGRREAGPGRREMVIPHRVFMQAIGALRGDGEHAADESLRLTPEQDDKIAALDREFRESMRAFTEQSRGEQPEAGRRARRAPGDAGAPSEMPADRVRERVDRPEGGPDGAPSPERRRERLDAMRENAPRPTDTHTKMFAVLDQPQRAFVKERVDAWRKQTEERMGEEYMQRRLRERQPEGAPPQGQPRPGAGRPGADRPGADRPGQGRPGADRPGAPDQDQPGAAPQRDRVRRLIERLGQLPPEERERILSRIEAALDQRLSEGAGPRGPRRGEDAAPKEDRPPEAAPPPGRRSRPDR
ncbi:MAG: hypothetical protein ACKVU4_15190 [Phycisphaerales bacterium]